MKTTSTNAPRVLVVLSNADVTHRQHLEGILKYVKENTRPTWEVVLDLRDINVANPLLLRERGFDAVIAAVHNGEDRRKYLRSKLPTVLFEPTLSRPKNHRLPKNVVTFFNDHEAEGITAAEYFLERDFSSFAFIGSPENSAWSESRMIGFKKRLELAHRRCRIYPQPPKCEWHDFALESIRLGEWLAKLPHRTAIFAAHDERAQQIVSTAAHLRLDVPNHIAVLGVDNDELLCNTASPTISSISVDARETGYRFAKALDDLIHHHDQSPIVRTCHTLVISRRSTDAFALSDPFLSRALSYAVANLDRRPRLEDLAREAHCSKRTLQQRATAVLGHPLKAELTRLQLNEADRRLKAGENIQEVAAKCGFCSAAHLRQRLAAHRVMRMPDWSCHGRAATLAHTRND